MNNTHALADGAGTTIGVTAATLGVLACQIWGGIYVGKKVAKKHGTGWGVAAGIGTGLAVGAVGGTAIQAITS